MALITRHIPGAKRSINKPESKQVENFEELLDIDYIKELKYNNLFEGFYQNNTLLMARLDGELDVVAYVDPASFISHLPLWSTVKREKQTIKK